MRATASPINKYPGMFDAVTRALYRMGNPEEVYIDDIRDQVAPEYGIEILSKRKYKHGNIRFNESVSRAVREKGYRKYRAKLFRKVNSTPAEVSA